MSKAICRSIGRLDIGQNHQKLVTFPISSFPWEFLRFSIQFRSKSLYFECYRFFREEVDTTWTHNISWLERVRFCLSCITWQILTLYQVINHFVSMLTEGWVSPRLCDFRWKYRSNSMNSSRYLLYIHHNSFGFFFIHVCEIFWIHEAANSVQRWKVDSKDYEFGSKCFSFLVTADSKKPATPNRRTRQVPANDVRETKLWSRQRDSVDIRFTIQIWARRQQEDRWFRGARTRGDQEMPRARISTAKASQNRQLKASIYIY